MAWALELWSFDDVASPVRALAVSGGRVYVGGGFVAIGPEPASNFAQLRPSP